MALEPQLLSKRRSNGVTRRSMLSGAAGLGGIALAAPVEAIARQARSDRPSGKHREGRDEPILDPDLPIIDAHHHLFVRPDQRYLIDDYLGDAGAGHRIVASIYVETLAFARKDGPALLRPLGEVEFANGVGAMTADDAFGGVRACAAIVGHADMRLGDEVARLLDRCLETAPLRFRGVRQVAQEHSSAAPYRFMPTRPPPGLFRHPGFHAAFRHLAPRGLLFEAAVFDHQLPDVAALADAFPDTTISLNHLGLAMGLDMAPDERRRLFERWRLAMRELARRPNVVCKVGGLGLPFWGFGFEKLARPVGYRELADAWRPYVETGMEVFGTDRCMAESNYPPDGRSCGFVPLWNALKHIVAGCPASEKAAFFHDTAARIYRIAPAA